ncbi:MAG: hypothetical protein MJZ16_14140 [Bacteroidales bacterium]|nr:hypothetical protein [Bacteroidales bacterium]
MKVQRILNEDDYAEIISILESCDETMEQIEDELSEIDGSNGYINLIYREMDRLKKILQIES